MKPLKTLIKLNKKKLDDLVKQINNLEEQKNLLTISLQELKEQILIELKKYSGTEYAFMLDNYLKRAKENEKN